MIQTPVIHGRLFHITNLAGGLKSSLGPLWTMTSLALKKQFPEYFASVILVSYSWQLILPSHLTRNHMSFIQIYYMNDPDRVFSSLSNFIIPISQASIVSLPLSPLIFWVPHPIMFWAFKKFFHSKIPKMSIIVPKIWSDLLQQKPTLWNPFIFWFSFYCCNKTLAKANLGRRGFIS